MKQIYPICIIFATLLIGCAGSSTSKDQSTPKRDTIVIAAPEVSATIPAEAPQIESVEVFDLVVGTYAGSTEPAIKELRLKGFSNAFAVPITDDKGKRMNRVIAERARNNADALRIKASLERQGVQAWIWKHQAGSSDVISSKRQDSKYKCASPYTRVAAFLPNNISGNKINIYKKPDKHSATIGTLAESIEGYCQGILIEHTNSKWDKIRVRGKVGYVERAKVEYQNWDEGGRKAIVAAKSLTPIYLESQEDFVENPIDDYVEKGTILSTSSIESFIDEKGLKWYILRTPHDFLFVKANDVKIVSR